MLIHCYVEIFGYDYDCFTTDSSIFLRSKSGAFRTCRLDAQQKFQETRKHCEMCDKNENGGNVDGDNVDTYIKLLVASIVCKFRQHAHIYKNDWARSFFIEVICFFSSSIFFVCPFFSISFWIHNEYKTKYTFSFCIITNIHTVWSGKDQT